ncbi:UNVERIFIED_CONTAM: hypothetical protein HDU68_003120 [Siphonaria sp. JEL0065]|nr:hypothetical protein HDU68_003120 [Siphonaria sp. JEL0065]
MIVLVYIVVAIILLLVVPLATFPLWRNELNPSRVNDRRHHSNSSVVATAQVSKALYQLGLFAQPILPKYSAVHPMLRQAAARFVAYDVPWIFKWVVATAVVDVGLSLLPVDTDRLRMRVTQARFYVLFAYILGHVIGLTGHLQTIYKVWSNSATGEGGRTLDSSSSSSTSFSSVNASAARSRLLNNRNTPGPNLFGMSELKTNEQNESLRRELEKKAPHTGLDAMLGMGLKHGASGVVGGIEKFYGTGNKLGGGSSSGSLGSNGTNGKRDVRGSYERIDV